MKFITAVVILAFTVAVQSSVIPLTSVINPWGTVQVAGVHGLPLATTLHGAVLASPGISAISSAPGSLSITHSGPAVIAAPVAVHVIPASGSYVAANRGTVHTAPLPGHAESAVSLNLEPAPGTV